MRLHFTYIVAAACLQRCHCLYFPVRRSLLGKLLLCVVWNSTNGAKLNWL